MNKQTINYKGFEIEIEYDDISDEWIATGKEDGSSFVLANEDRDTCLSQIKEEIDMLITSRYLNRLGREGFSEH